MPSCMCKLHTFPWKWWQSSILIFIFTEITCFSLNEREFLPSCIAPVFITNSNYWQQFLYYDIVALLYNNWPHYFLIWVLAFTQWYCWLVQTLGIWHWVVGYVDPHISKYLDVFLFRVKQSLYTSGTMRQQHSVMPHMTGISTFTCSTHIEFCSSYFMHDFLALPWICPWTFIVIPMKHTATVSRERSNQETQTGNQNILLQSACAVILYRT